MRCYYCDGEAENIERLGNKKIPICYNKICQKVFYEAEQKDKDEKRDYDAWRTRSE